jgi:hypothetical protein
MKLATNECSKASADLSALGMYVPIYPLSAIGEARPHLLILPRNLKSEIVEPISDAGSCRKMAIPIPNIEVMDPEDFGP